MNATVLTYPKDHEKGGLVIQADQVKPDIKNLGYNVFSHPVVNINIDVDKLPEQRTPEMYFTAYTHSVTKEKLNIGGEVWVQYADGTSMYMIGSYDPVKMILSLT